MRLRNLCEVMPIRNILTEAEGLRHMPRHNSIPSGSTIDRYLNLFQKRMQLTKTQLPDKRYYETYDTESERNIRFNELKNRGHKPEQGRYLSVN